MHLTVGCLAPAPSPAPASVDTDISALTFCRSSGGQSKSKSKSKGNSGREMYIKSARSCAGRTLERIPANPNVECWGDAIQYQQTTTSGQPSGRRAHPKKAPHDNSTSRVVRWQYYLCFEVGAVPVEVHPHFPADECLWVGVLVILGRAPDAHRRSRGPAAGKRTSARLNVWVRIRVNHLDRAPAKIFNF